MFETGVKQGCILSSFIFLIILDFVDDSSFGIGGGGVQTKLVDMEFSDDLFDLSHALAGIQAMANNIDTFEANIGL